MEKKTKTRPHSQNHTQTHLPLTHRSCSIQRETDPLSSLGVPPPNPQKNHAKGSHQAAVTANEGKRPANPCYRCGERYFPATNVRTTLYLPYKNIRKKKIKMRIRKNQKKRKVQGPYRYKLLKVLLKEERLK